MTTAKQKQDERFYVEQAIRSLRTEWTILAEPEPPDFLVQDGGRTFGLEVRQIFKDPQSAAGSEIKKREAKTQRMLDRLRAEFEQRAPIPLIVKFLGRIDLDTISPISKLLLDLDLAAKPIAFQTIFKPHADLKVYVTKGLRAEWFSVNDRVGWIDFNAQHVIANAIEEKSRKLPLYQAAAGPDVRLLLVANAIHNSGRLRLDGECQFDLRGFTSVYLLRYPDDANVLSADRTGTIRS